MKKYFILRLLVYEFFLFISLSLILTALVYFKILNSEHLLIASLIINSINIIAISFIVVKHYKKHGLLLGLLVGAIYVGASLIANLLTDQTIDTNLLIKELIVLLISMTTGCVTINVISRK